MNVHQLPITGAFVIHNNKLGDDRGWFSEVFRKSWLHDIDVHDDFIFEFWSFSKNKGTLRGLHAQTNVTPQSKLVSVLNGSIQDVIVDARVDSPTFGKYCDVQISNDNPGLIYIPQGCYHGFITLEENTYVGYRVNNYHNAEAECGVMWDDPVLNIQWANNPQTISNRDKSHPYWDKAYKFKGKQ